MTETDILSLTNRTIVVAPNTTAGVTALPLQVQAFIALVAGVTGSVVSSATSSATTGFWLGATPLNLGRVRGIFYVASAGATCTFTVLTGHTQGTL